MLAQLRRAAMTPLWLAQLSTGTKSFERNPIIGSRRLNEWGLHAARVALAHRLARGPPPQARRADLARGPRGVRSGRVCRPREIFCEPEHFAALARRGQGLSRPAARDLRGRHGHAQDRPRPAAPWPGCRRSARRCDRAEWRGLDPLCRKPRCRASGAGCRRSCATLARVRPTRRPGSMPTPFIRRSRRGCS